VLAIADSCTKKIPKQTNKPLDFSALLESDYLHEFCCHESIYFPHISVFVCFKKKR